MELLTFLRLFLNCPLALGIYAYVSRFIITTFDKCSKLFDRCSKLNEQMDIYFSFSL